MSARFHAAAMYPGAISCEPSAANENARVTADALPGPALPALPRLFDRHDLDLVAQVRRAFGESLDHPFHAAGARPVVLREMENAHEESRQVHHDPRPKSTASIPLVLAPCGARLVAVRALVISRVYADPAARGKLRALAGLGATVAAAVPDRWVPAGLVRAAADQLGRRRRRPHRPRARFAAARCPRRIRSGTAAPSAACSPTSGPELVQIEEEPWSNGAAAIARAARRLRIPYVLLTRESLPVSRSTLAAAPPEPRARRRGRASSRSTSSPGAWRSRGHPSLPHRTIPQLGVAAPARASTARRHHRARHRIRRPADSARRASTCCSAPRSSSSAGGPSPWSAPGPRRRSSRASPSGWASPAGSPGSARLPRSRGGRGLAPARRRRRALAHYPALDRGHAPRRARRDGPRHRGRRQRRAAPCRRPLGDAGLVVPEEDVGALADDAPAPARRSGGGPAAWARPAGAA